MKIIDKYISKEFIYSLIGTIFICSVVLFVSLIFENYEDIRGKDVSFLVTLEFFIFSMPYKIVKVLPLTMILAVLFSIGHLAKNNEILAIVASGVDRIRIVYSVIIIAFIVSILSIFFNETIVSYAENKAEKIKQIYIKGESLATIDTNKNIFLKGKGKRFYNMEYFDGTKNKNLMGQPTIFVVNQDNSSLAWRLDASTAQNFEKSNIWRFKDAIVRDFNQDGIVTSIKKYNTPLDLPMEEDLSTFLSVRKKPEEMNFSELWRYIKIVEPRGIPTSDYKTDLHLKIAFPLSCLIVTLLGIPFALRTKAGNMIIGFGFGIMVSIVYYALTALSRSMGQTGVFPPLIAAWLPNVVSLYIGVYILKKTQQ